MLTILLPATDDHEAVTLNLEHSLVSLSKWEAIHEKAFYGRDAKTHEETLSYLEQMIVGEVPDEFFSRLVPENVIAVNEYLNSKQSATWFNETPQQGGGGSRETISTELVYYWLVQFNIPFDPAETWHFNRLMNLIKICGIKQSKPKKMSPQARAEQMRRINEQRRKELGTEG